MVSNCHPPISYKFKANILPQNATLMCSLVPQGRANKCKQESMQHVLRFIKKELSCFSLQKYEPGSTLTPFRRALASLLRYDGSLILSLMIFCCNFCLLLCAKGGYNHEDDRISHQHWNQWHCMHIS